MPIKVAACQVPDAQMDIEAMLRLIESFAADAQADLVCFPECFLQGYLTDEALARKHAIDLSSPEFTEILSRLGALKSMLVFGMIERDGKQLFNIAVVVHEGHLVGKYRKAHLLPGEQVFTPGDSYPIFELNGTKFGINICYDMQFPEPAAAVAQQGASIILCPANNMMRRENAEKYKELHHEMRIERARENRVWIVSADVMGMRGERISYGPTSIISPEGDVVKQVSLMEAGFVSIELPS